MSNDAKLLSLESILEAPPQSETTTSPLVALFSDSTLALSQATAKANALEFFLRLTTQDRPFNDFVSDLLLCFLRIVNSEAGTIFEVDHASETLFFRAAAGRASDTVRNFRVPIGQGVVGYVAESRQPLVVSDANENSRHLKQIGKTVGFETRNLIAVPIIIRGRIFGVLELLNRMGEKQYTEHDAELLRYLCEMAAKAIEIRLMIAWGAQARPNRKSERDEVA